MREERTNLSRARMQLSRRHRRARSQQSPRIIIAQHACRMFTRMDLLIAVICESRPRRYTEWLFIPYGAATVLLDIGPSICFDVQTGGHIRIRSAGKSRDPLQNIRVICGSYNGTEKVKSVLKINQISLSCNENCRRMKNFAWIKIINDAKRILYIVSLLLNASKRLDI